MIELITDLMSIGCEVPVVKINSPVYIRRSVQSATYIPLYPGHSQLKKGVKPEEEPTTYIAYVLKNFPR